MKQQVTFHRSGLPQYPDAFEVSAFFLGGVIKQNQNESQIFHDLFLL